MPGPWSLWCSFDPVRIVVEGGSNSPWVTRLPGEPNHEVIPADPRKPRLTYEIERRDDRVDAEYMVRVRRQARVRRQDPELLAPIVHRRADTQADLGVLRAREGLARCRTALADHVRGSVKAVGGRRPSCCTASFPAKVAESISPASWRTCCTRFWRPWPSSPGRSDNSIDGSRSFAGSGTRRPSCCGRSAARALTARCYVLVIEDPVWFEKGREVAPHPGLVPGRDRSSASDPDRGITKVGSPMHRQPSVRAAHLPGTPVAQES